MHKIKKFCLVCDGSLTTYETEQQQVCSICGTSFEAVEGCENGHHVCYNCHHKAAREDIIAHCQKTSEADPFTLLVELMKLPKTRIHGPEHHLIMPAALLTCYRNSGKELDLEAALSEANARSMQVPGAVCAFWGACGAAIGTGIYYSILTETSPYSTDSWKETGQLTARCVDAISVQGGPRCCKRDSFLALLQVLPYSNEMLGTNFAVPEKITCEFLINNSDCKGKACPFFPTPK